MNQEAIRNRAEGYKQTLPNSERWDSVNSTFRWEIFLDSTQKAEILYGYSKGKDVPEHEDKHYVVKSRFLNAVFINNGYYKKIDKINFYFNECSMNGEKIFTLYKTHYELYQFDDELDEMLKQTYQRIDKLQNQPQKTMSSVFKKRPKKHRTDKTKSPTDEAINLDKIKSMSEFNSLITDLESKNYSYGLIQGLKFKIREMHPDWLMPSDVQAVSQKPKKEPYQEKRTELLRKWSKCKEKVRFDKTITHLNTDFQRIRFGTIKKGVLILNPENSEHLRQIQQNTDMRKLLGLIMQEFGAKDLKFTIPEPAGNIQELRKNRPKSTPDATVLGDLMAQKMAQKMAEKPKPDSSF